MADCDREYLVLLRYHKNTTNKFILHKEKNYSIKTGVLCFSFYSGEEDKQFTLQIESKT